MTGQCVCSACGGRLAGPRSAVLRAPLVRPSKSSLRVRARAQPGGGGSSSSDDSSVVSSQDWRAFRARLVAQESSEDADSSSANAGRSPSPDNLRLLQVQNPTLAQEPFWAHATAQPETGGLLLASPGAPTLVGDIYWQAVVLIIQHSLLGVVGLLLNRPSSLRLGPGRGGLPTPMLGAPEGLQVAFADNRIYCGGMSRQEVFHLLHGHRLEGAVEVVPGVFLGGEAAAVQAVASGAAQADDFKFFSGACVWTEGELQREIAQGAWLPAAASRPLLLKQVLQLPKPLWREVVELMGETEATAGWLSSDD